MAGGGQDYGGDDQVSSSNPLTNEERLALIKDVCQMAFDNSESFRESHFGADLAYLVTAIVDDEHVSVDWTEEGYGDKCELLGMIGSFYDQRHNIWKFIIRDEKEHCPECERSRGRHYVGKCEH